MVTVWCLGESCGLIWGLCYGRDLTNFEELLLIVLLIKRSCFEGTSRRSKVLWSISEAVSWTGELCRREWEENRLIPKDW